MEVIDTIQAKKWWETKNDIQKGLLYAMYFPAINGFCTQLWNISDDEITLMYWEITTATNQ